MGSFVTDKGVQELTQLTKLRRLQVDTTCGSMISRELAPTDLKYGYGNMAIDGFGSDEVAKMVSFQ